MTLALRSALALALWAHALFFLALIGQLRPLPIVVLAIVFAFVVARSFGPSLRWLLTGAALAAPLLLLALRPPIAFDETLYHLPFIRALAESGELRFQPNIRFAAIPQLQELLCVPLYLLAGDTATHLMSLAEILITAALLFEWGRKYDARAGMLAAALFIGSPIVIHLATIGYVEPALTLFVAAGFYCLDRRSFFLAGFFLGTASSVKYLGFFFAAAAVVLAGRAWWRVAATFLAAASPTTLWLIVTTGNPVFPFFPGLFGANAWGLPPKDAPLATRAMRTLRVLWDVTFARDRVNQQPPFTPFLIPALLIALRDVRGRIVAAMFALYLVAFAWLPQDSRYLVPLLPLVSIAAAIAMGTPASSPADQEPSRLLEAARRRLISRRDAGAPWLIALVAAPGILYIGYALAVRGLPPMTLQAREAWLAQRIPEYTALRRADAERIYVCGAEQLKHYARGELLGDHAGPYPFNRVLRRMDTTSAIAASMRSIDARFFLLSKRKCAAPRDDGGIDLVYEDAAAQLWRVQSSPSRR